MVDKKEEVYQLMYQSEAIDTLTKKDIKDIVDVSKKNNSDKGITGFLVFNNRQFMQLLEGDEEAVKHLYHEKIVKDKRHQKSVVIKESRGVRICSHWSMAHLPVGVFPHKKFM